MRNRLIDEVYLPLVGENLAKQIGAMRMSSGAPIRWACCCSFRLPATARPRSWNTWPTGSA
ncbi:hypothetical protein LP419_38430 [Massilia sp. H-1]|nr:hypothetical protein LP419_38430 [Massilia sp. H-1]